MDSGSDVISDGQPAPIGNYPTARNGDVLLGNPDYPAISYGAFRTTERSEDNVPSVAEIKEDLRLMQAMGIKLLRTYNTQGFSDTANLLVAIDELMAEDPDYEMYVMLGVWIDALNSWTDEPVVRDENNPSNYMERAKAIEMVQAYPEIIKVIAVGNEAMVHWAPYHVTPGIILEHVTHLQDLKAAGDIPADVWITSSDNWASWSGQGEYANPELDALAASVDFVSVHTYPFHDTHYNNAFWLVPEDEQGLDRMQQIDRAMERATEYAWSQVQLVRDYLNSQGLAKQIHIGETGWSSYTNLLYGDAGSRAADEYKQKAFFMATRAWSNEYGASLFYFQAFDEPWKGDPVNSGDSEKHFGLIDIAGKAKYLIWDLVDQGAFDGLTRAGVAITKSHDGDEQSLLDAVLAPPLAPVVGGPIEGDEYVVMDTELADGLRTVTWEDTSWLAVESGVLTLTTPPTAGAARDWGWGAGLQLQGGSGLNLTGFEDGTLGFEIRGDTTTNIQIGFQTGVFGDGARPQTNNFGLFGPGARSITDDWQAYSLSIDEITNGADFSDVTSPLYFSGSTVDGGSIQVRNIKFLK
jgi:exo-beta-1,3-glucanase (GH17 family)